MIDFERVYNKNLYSMHVRTTQKAEISGSCTKIKKKTCKCRKTRFQGIFNFNL